MQVYDTNNDGVLREDDLREVLKAMIIENGMEFNDEEVQHVPQRIIFPLIYSYTSPQRSIFALISSYSSPQRCGTLLVFSSRTGARREEIISLLKTSRSSCQGRKIMLSIIMTINILTNMIMTNIMTITPTGRRGCLPTWPS